MSSITVVRKAMRVANAANEHILSYVSGTRISQVGPLLCIHYDKPLWWETDAFQALDIEPHEVVASVQAYHPGAHLIAVVTDDPEGVIAPYAALDYKTVPNEPMEIVMTRDFKAFQPAEERHLVHYVETEHQRSFYNSVIDADEPHGQLKPEQLEDPKLRHYYIEQDGQCVCTARAILPGYAAVNIEPLCTHASYRRQGMATSLMNRIHADAAKLGAEQSVIVATAMGQVLYSTLGYVTVAYIQKFVSQGWSRDNLAGIATGLP